MSAKVQDPLELVVKTQGVWASSVLNTAKPSPKSRFRKITHFPVSLQLHFNLLEENQS